MARVTIDEAKANLARLIEEAQRGGDIVILRGEKPIARLLPIEPTLPRPKRKPGG